jgi:hypothetical protein
MESIEQRLSGGHPNSLGNTVEVVEEVLINPKQLQELFNCYFSDNKVVRLRVSNAMKRIANRNKALLITYLPRLLEDISKIDQDSTRWTLAQLFDTYTEEMDGDQRLAATQIMKGNLLKSDDWIVQNTTMSTLGKWAMKDLALKSWLVPYLERKRNDQRKSVKNKASNTLEKLL